jgi:hypothetical protein
VVSFKLLPLYHQRKRPRYPLDRRSGGPLSRSAGCDEVEVKSLDPFVVQPIASRYTDYATADEDDEDNNNNNNDDVIFEALMR